MIIFKRQLTIYFINGCGIFLELADSRAAWVETEDGESLALPYKGVLLYLPFILISFGNVYGELES